MNLAGILILSIVAVFCLSAAAFIGIVRRVGWRPGARIMILRMAILLLTAILLWQMFQGGKTINREIPDPAGRASHVIVLQDKSLSMGFPASRTVSREVLAEQVWRQVVVQSRALASSKVEVTRLYFGGNLVEEKNLGRLDRDSTRLNNAVIKAITERNTDALLVVSDGATEDTALPKFLTDNIAGRNILVYALVAGIRAQDVYDIAVQSVSCNQSGPSRVNAGIACTGRGITAFPVAFSIDGGSVTRVTCEPQPLQTVSFDVPAGTKAGWHYFEVSVPPLEGEISSSNNVLRGSFRTDRKDRFLFLMDNPPRSENVQMVRLLKDQYQDTFEAVTVESGKLEGMNPREWRFIVVSDVAPGRLPPAWLEAVKSGALPLVLLAGKNLPEWQREGITGFPVQGSVKRIQISKDDEIPGAVETDGFAEFAGMTGRNYGHLPLNVVPSAVLADGSVTVLSARAPNGRSYPLIVANSKKKTGMVVFLVENTWKWAIHYDQAVRTGFRSLLADLFKWISVSVASEAINLELPGEHGPVVQAEISVADEATARRIESMKLQFSSGGDIHAVQPARKGDTWQLLIDSPSRKDVIWLQAVAKTRNGKLMSEQRPLLPPDSPRELRYTDLEPAALRSLCGTAKDSFGYCEDSGIVISNMLGRLYRHKDETAAIHERNITIELILTFVIIMLMMAEWWLERHMRGKMTA